MEVSSQVFACYSAACRPPTSGGTGGSSKGSGRGGKTGDGIWKVGDYTITKEKKGYKVTRPDGGINTAGTLKRAKSAVARAQAATKQGETSTIHQKPTVATKPVAKNPGTPGYTPRSMTKMQAENEINNIIIDSENRGYEPDWGEAASFVRGFNEMRQTGKPSTYNSYYNSGLPIKVGETRWHTKLDYEVAFPVDTIAAYLDMPLTS